MTQGAGDQHAGACLVASTYANGHQSQDPSLSTDLASLEQVPESDEQGAGLKIRETAHGHQVQDHLLA